MTHVTETIPGVYRLELPLPFELSTINVYLVRLDEGYMLVDCGMRTGSAFNALRSAMKHLGLDWKAIRIILLTHMHPDHVGLAEQLLSLSGAKLYMHVEEADLLALVSAQDPHPWWIDQAMLYGGVPARFSKDITSSFQLVRKNFQRLHPDWIMSGGERIPSAIGTLETVWTPGHSPGHLCVYGAAQKVLFSGDHILENITPNISWDAKRDMLAEYLDSLERVERLDVELILPSHGVPFPGHKDRIRATIAHHADRCSVITAGLRESEKTANDLVGLLWNRKLSPFNHRFAVFEVLAHLEYMKRRGEVAVRTNGTGAWHWSLPSSEA